MRLHEMSPQQEGVIEKVVDTNLPCVQRLMTYGLVEGTTIKYVSSVGSDGPIEIELYGSKLALRKDCADHFNVRLK